MKLFRFNILIIFFNLINNSKCIYEDQVGSYDWRQQYIGKAIYSKVDALKNKVFLATDQNLLCAINKKNGNLMWRKLFEKDSKGNVNYVLWSFKEIILINANGQRIQAFNYNNGYLNWEFNLFKNNSLNLNYYGFESKVETEAYYFTNGQELCYINSKDKSCTDLPTELDYSFTNIYENNHGVFAIGIKDKSIIKLQFNGILNSLLSKSTIDIDWIASNNQCFQVNSQLICQNGDKIKIAEIKVNDLVFETYSLPQQISTNSQISFINSENILFNENEKYYLLRKNQNDKIFNLLRTFEDMHKYHVTSYDNDEFMVVAKITEQKLKFYTYFLTSGEERTDLFISSESVNLRNIIYFDTNIYEIKSSQLVVNALCVFSDHSLSLIGHTGSKLFTREEALANIIAVEMFDFPLTYLQEEFEDEFGKSESNNLLLMFLRRLKSQFFQLKDAIKDLYSNILGLNKSSNENKDSLSLKRDEFNLNKIIIAVTSIGKVFGLHSSNGQIIWSFYIDKILPFEYNDKKIIPLFVQRTAAHYPYEAQCAIVAKYPNNNNEENTLIRFFNPLNGLLSKDYSNDLILPFKPKQTFLANTIDNQFLKPLIFFDNEKKIHIYPKSAENLIIKSQKPYIIYVADVNSLSGYVIKYTNKRLEKLWNINLEDETIVSIGCKLNHDRIHSHGKVLGDRSVLYKYLNPNMIAVVTEGLDTQKVPFLNIYLIDTINGNIINSYNHKRSKGPVHILHSENWFFYSYFNLKYRRFEVTSIELFEGSTQYNSTHFNAFDAIKPVTHSKSYIVQKSFDAMQITLTEKGISTKDIIVACPSGTIIEIPWILIDPRRPFEMTEIDREENLIPYMPEIPLNYEFSLNYYNYVYNIRGITTAASGLESTSLVFAYGLDIFFTRVFPSKTFDMLKEDFDYFFLSILMFGLMLGTILSKKLASSSVLKKAWK